jgi:hypothetical protein
MYLESCMAVDAPNVYFRLMRSDKTFAQLFHEFTVLKQRLSQSADPLERREILLKMSDMLRETDTLAQHFLDERTPPER